MNIAAVAYGALVAVNIAWPRNSVYNALGTPHWYWQWSPVLFIGARRDHRLDLLLRVQAKKPPEVLAEHRADVPTIPEPALGDVAP